MTHHDCEIQSPRKLLLYHIVSVLIDILKYCDSSNTNHVLITRVVWGKHTIDSRGYVHTKEEFELVYHSISQGGHIILYGFHRKITGLYVLSCIYTCNNQ